MFNISIRTNILGRANSTCPGKGKFPIGPFHNQTNQHSDWLALGMSQYHWRRAQSDSHSKAEFGNCLQLKKIKKGEVLSTVESVGRQDSKDNLYELRKVSELSPSLFRTRRSIVQPWSVLSEDS